MVIKAKSLDNTGIALWRRMFFLALSGCPVHKGPLFWHACLNVCVHVCLEILFIFLCIIACISCLIDVCTCVILNVYAQLIFFFFFHLLSL